MFPRQDCPCGQRGKEIDHRLAIAIAARLGVKEYCLAVSYTNLVWLCVDCHKTKTKEDRRTLANLDRKTKGQPSLGDPGPQVRLFDTDANGILTKGVSVTDPKVKCAKCGILAELAERTVMAEDGTSKAVLMLVCPDAECGEARAVPADVQAQMEGRPRLL